MMNLELLEIAKDYTNYMNEVNNNCFTELENLDSIYTMYQQLEYYLQSGDKCTINEYIETAENEKNNSIHCGLKVDDSINNFLSWVSDNE